MRAMNVALKSVSRGLLAYLAAAFAGYVCAIVFATSANLINLADIGASIGIGDALRTYVFDLWGMTPRFTELTRQYKKKLEAELKK